MRERKSGLNTPQTIILNIIRPYLKMVGHLYGDNEHETIFKPNELIDFFDGFRCSPTVVEYAQFDQGYYPRRAYTLDRRNYKWVRYGFEFEYYDGPRLKLETNYSAINAYKKAGY